MLLGRACKNALIVCCLLVKSMHVYWDARAGPALPPAVVWGRAGAKAVPLLPCTDVSPNTPVQPILHRLES